MLNCNNEDGVGEYTVEEVELLGGDQKSILNLFTSLPQRPKDSVPNLLALNRQPTKEGNIHHQQ